MLIIGPAICACQSASQTAWKLRSLGYTLLEVGPGRTLSVLARQQLAKNQDQIVLSSMPEPAGKYTEEDSVLDVLGRLWLSGVDPDWKAVYAGEKRRRVPISPYPFERKRYWIESSRTNTSPGAEISLGSDHSEVTGCTDSTIYELPTRNYDLQATESRRHERNATGTENMELAQPLEHEVQIRPLLLAIYSDLSGIDLSATGGSITFLELGFDHCLTRFASVAIEVRNKDYLSPAAGPAIQTRCACGAYRITSGAGRYQRPRRFITDNTIAARRRGPISSEQ